MRDGSHFYIGGEWVSPLGDQRRAVINPASDTEFGSIIMGSAADVDRAANAARQAFDAFSTTTVADRLVLLERIIECYLPRLPDLAAAITEEMGAPAWLSEQVQAVLGVAHFQTARAVLANYEFSEDLGSTRVVKEAIGVCGFITPWNWPLNQIGCKVAPALATGCTVVLKPSEMTPFSAVIFAEILHEAGVPAGVFNLVQGDGPTVGAALGSHPEIDMVSFTGSTRAGVEIARAAAPTVKRVLQELGGKSPNIILESADLDVAVRGGVDMMMLNSGQSCNAPSRMFVPRDRMEEAIVIARDAAEAWSVGDPNANSKMGPVASRAQWTKIQGLIEAGLSEGGRLVTGGPGRPEGLDHGCYVRPTVFADVTNDMTIAREEIFGPVLSILAYDTRDQAVAMGNDTAYGLSAYVQGDLEEARGVAAKLRAGQVVLNGAGLDMNAPFGGYKQSGNGREWGAHAFADFLEIKAIVGNRPG